MLIDFWLHIGLDWYSTIRIINSLTYTNISWFIPITQIKTRDWNATDVRYFILNTYVPFLAKPQKRTHIKNFAIEILFMTCHFIPVAISYT